MKKIVLIHCNDKITLNIDLKNNKILDKKYEGKKSNLFLMNLYEKDDCELLKYFENKTGCNGWRELIDIINENHLNCAIDSLYGEIINYGGDKDEQ